MTPTAFPTARTPSPKASIQRNARTKRFGAISYSTDGSNTRDGGVLRSNMKYVGPTLPDGTTNSVAEFPHRRHAGEQSRRRHRRAQQRRHQLHQQVQRRGYKSLDPVSELFYESIRYFKHLGPTPEYSAGLTTAQLGGFQIVNSWSDPQQYKCQKNFIIAINDANPWLDKRLPGTYFTSSTISGASGTVTLDGNDYGEPSNADHDINVRDLTNRVGAMEGLHSLWSDSGTWASTGAKQHQRRERQRRRRPGHVRQRLCGSKTVTGLGEVMGTCPYAPKQNSYYVAGLAYYANTTDLRSDFDNDRGIQNVQTFMIDTQEFNTNPLDGPKNMLWLTGKYGGFNDADSDAVPDPAEWDADGDGAPDNYVLATQPQNLVNGLDRAFDFIDSRLSSASSASVNSGSISDLTPHLPDALQQRHLDRSLLAFAINDDGTLGNGVPPLTDAEADGMQPRNCPRGARARSSRATRRRGPRFPLELARYPAADAARQPGNARISARRRHQRGITSRGKFRPRDVTKLGDIVSSAPLFVGRPPFRYRDNLEGSGSVAYSTFVLANDTDAERTPMVYAGANDGMLHGFNANTGVEVFAFVPTPMFKTIGASPLGASPSWRNRTTCTSTSSTVRRAWAMRTGVAPGIRSSPAA